MFTSGYSGHYREEELCLNYPTDRYFYDEYFYDEPTEELLDEDEDEDEDENDKETYNFDPIFGNDPWIF